LNTTERRHNRLTVKPVDEYDEVAAVFAIGFYIYWFAWNKVGNTRNRGWDVDVKATRVFQLIKKQTFGRDAPVKKPDQVQKCTSDRVILRTSDKVLLLRNIIRS